MKNVSAGAVDDAAAALHVFHLILNQARDIGAVRRRAPKKARRNERHAAEPSAMSRHFNCGVSFSEIRVAPPPNFCLRSRPKMKDALRLVHSAVTHASFIFGR